MSKSLADHRLTRLANQSTSLIRNSINTKSLNLRRYDMDPGTITALVAYTSISATTTSLATLQLNVAYSV